MNKWRVFKIGKYKLSFNQLETVSSSGHDLSCGHDITRIANTFVVNGIEKKRWRVRYKVQADIVQRLRISELANKGKMIEINSGKKGQK